MNSDIVTVIATLMLGQVAGAVVLVAVLKNELKWVKRTQQDHENRLRSIERGKTMPQEFGLSDFL